MSYFTSFSNDKSSESGVFYTYSPSQFELAIFQVLSNHKWSSDCCIKQDTTILQGEIWVLIHSGCHKKVPWTGCLINSRKLFLTVLEAGSLRSWCQHGLGLVKALFQVSDY